jgi:hypothetical protein
VRQADDKNRRTRHAVSLQNKGASGCRKTFHLFNGAGSPNPTLKYCMAHKDVLHTLQNRRDISGCSRTLRPVPPIIACQGADEPRSGPGCLRGRRLPPNKIFRLYTRRSPLPRGYHDDIDIDILSLDKIMKTILYKCMFICLWEE